MLHADCTTCHTFLQRDPRSTHVPKLLNVMVVSVQPERNIQLYPTSGVSQCNCYHTVLLYPISDDLHLLRAAHFITV